jgi:dCMP deaminase
VLRDRPEWDDYFIGLAEQAAIMSTCGKKKVGAVLVNPKTKQVVSTGFNGSPRGMEHCTDMTKHICEGGCLNDEKRCLRAIHAEHNAILSAKQDVSGMTMYCTDQPCENCTKYMIQAGITKCVYLNAYENRYHKFFADGIAWVHHYKNDSKTTTGKQLLQFEDASTSDEADIALRVKTPEILGRVGKTTPYFKHSKRVGPEDNKLATYIVTTEDEERFILQAERSKGLHLDKTIIGLFSYTYRYTIWEAEEGN